jgi:hypothetical protein
LFLLPVAIVSLQGDHSLDYSKIAKGFITTYLNRSKNSEGSYQQTSIWFTAELNQLMSDYIKFRSKDIKEHPKEMPDPSIEEKISTFWDLPSHVEITSTNESGDSATVLLLCTWGKGTDYEGDKQPISLIFRKSPKGWKIDNITTPDGKFVSRSDLREELSKKQLP